MKSTRQIEIQYIRIQTFIAGISLISTLAMSAIGLWIGVQINENAEIQRRHESEEQAKAEKIREKNQLDFNCLNMIVQLSNVSEKFGRDSSDVTSIVKSIDDKCQNSAIISPSSLVSYRVQSEIYDVDAFLRWAYSDQYVKIDDVKNGYKIYRGTCELCNKPPETPVDKAGNFEHWVSSHER